MNGRDEKGRFVNGHNHSVGKGRPPKSREERYHEILLRTCKFSDWREIVARAVVQAKRGDKDARKWLTDYLVGPAAQTLKLDANVGWWELMADLGGVDRGDVAGLGSEDGDV